jgi:UDP-3-O-[3-hydroxymyristoyl] glucosamine N-acyltransferase
MVTFQQVAEFLDGEVLDSSRFAHWCRPMPVLEAGADDVSFVHGKGRIARDIAEKSLAGILIVEKPLLFKENAAVVVRVDNSRLTFAGLINKLFAPSPLVDCVKFGKNTCIKKGAVVGESGFGFERDEDGAPVRFPHIGGVVLGDDVEIGSNSCVDRGALTDTVIGDRTKIDNLVHIAHNVRIGSDCLIAAGATICGSAHIGDGVWIGPGAVISDYVKVGDGASVTIGSVVVKDVPPHTTVTGYFAIDHKKYLRGAR